MSTRDDRIQSAASTLSVHPVALSPTLSSYSVEGSYMPAIENCEALNSNGYQRHAIVFAARPALLPPIARIDQDRGEADEEKFDYEQVFADEMTITTTTAETTTTITTTETTATATTTTIPKPTQIIVEADVIETIHSASSTRSTSLPISYRSISRALENGSREFVPTQLEYDVELEEIDDEEDEINEYDEDQITEFEEDNIIECRDIDDNDDLVEVLVIDYDQIDRVVRIDSSDEDVEDKSQDIDESQSQSEQGETISVDSSEDNNNNNKTIVESTQQTADEEIEKRPQVGLTSQETTIVQGVTHEMKKAEFPLLLPPPTQPKQLFSLERPPNDLSPGPHKQLPLVASSMASNSTCDSYDKLIFSRSTSDYSESLGEPNPFIKNVVLFTLVPYSLIGISVVGITYLAVSGDRITNSRQWVRFMRLTPRLALLNGLELAIVAFIDLYLLFLFLRPLVAWLVASQVANEELITFFIDVYEILPIIFAINIFWLKGYHLGPILRTIEGRIAFTPTADVPKVSQSLAKVVASVGCVLVALVGTIVSYEWKAANRYAIKERDDFYYHQAIRFFVMWLLPTHLSVLNGVHFRVVSLNNYIQTLAEQSTTIGINMLDFQKIKNLYKQNADLICKVNRVFNLMVSDIIIVILISILKDLLQVVLLFTAIDSYSNLTVAGVEANREFIVRATKWLVLDGLTIAARLVLIGLNFKKVIEINRDIKLINVFLHDLAAWYIEKPSDIYQSFCLTKYYIKARLDRTDDPALVRLYAAKWIPCLRLF